VTGLSFAVSMARREGRSSRRRLGLYMGSISLGVAALVSINSFRSNVIDAIHSESRGLLGADLELRSLRPFPDTLQKLLDSLVSSGIPISNATNFASMALAPRTQRTRMVEVRAMSGDFPYYGTITTEPPGRWASLQTGRFALIDPSVLVQLEVDVGDTLAIGTARFVIDGLISHIPGEFDFVTAFGGRIFIPGAYVEETGLLETGSRNVYRAFLKFANEETLDDFLNANREFLREQQIRYETARQREADFTEAISIMTRFLGLVGLVALLLGGVGVASAVHVFVKNKLSTVAILRCIGASQGTVFSIYLLQAGLLGLMGSALGVGIGIVVQATLPDVLRSFMPLEVTMSLVWPALIGGLLIGAWVAIIFTLLPLLEVRNVSPLQALRREFEASRGRSKLQLAALAAVIVTMAALSVGQAPNWATGAAFALALAVATSLLWLFAWIVMRTTRRFLPRRASYVVRQGIANLYRPHNQTVAVTLAVGFGIFLIATLYVVQRNLVSRLAVDATATRPSLVLFDIQADQREGVQQVLTARGLPLIATTPIVPARISHLNGRATSEILKDTTDRRRSRWPLTREYRNTYRDTLVSSERVVAGKWWGQEERENGLPSISLEKDLASQLAVSIGDHITWDIQGVQIETEIASFREVDWARLEPNFFVVFQPGSLDGVPQTFVTLTRAETATDRAELQRDVVLAFPNVVVMDLAAVQDAIESIVESVALAIRFMAFFSIASGMIVLVGAIATSRFQRIRESVLLKTLGARKRLIGRILLTEYTFLGLLAGLAGTVLGIFAGWAVVTLMFRLAFKLPNIQLVLLWLGTAAATASIGLFNSRDVFRKPPLVVIREMGE
jgi:putative ABC transport system permease protein